MQTTMIQLPQAPASPAAGKAPSAKGNGLFEELLGDKPRLSTKTLQGTDPFELLAAALNFGWPPLPTLPDGAAVVNEAELAAAIAAVATDSASAGLPLLTELAPGQELGLESAATPTQQLGAALLQTTESAPELLAGKRSAAGFQAPAPAAPLVGEKGALTPAPAAPLVGEGGALTPAIPAMMAVKEALAPVQPLPEKVAETGGVRPEIELLRGQKKLSEPGSPTREPLFSAATEEEPASEAGAKAAGPSEARFSEMLQGAVRGAPLHAAPRGDAPRGELPQELKAAPAKELFAAAAAPLVADEESAAAVANPVPSPANAPHLVAVSAPPQPPVAAAAAAPPVAALQLPSGQLVAESELLGQVLGRLQVGARRESSSISLKLNPEELGEVKLDLLVEKDRVKALIVTQNQQVQEVLERHLPRLREALQQQGLKLEELQVSVDSRQQDNARGFFQQEQRTASAAQTGGRRGAGRPDGERSELSQAVSAPAPSGLSIRI